MSRDEKEDDGRELVRAVTRAVVGRVGSSGPAVVEAVVAEVLAALGGGGGAATGGGRVSYVSPPGSQVVTTPRGSQLLPVVGSVPPAIDYCLSCVGQEKARNRNRAVLTITGRNGKGIVANVTAHIADLGGDILDISQTLVSDFFTMIIVIDVASLTVPFDRFQDEVTRSVRERGCHAMLMHDDVLTSLHRVQEMLWDSEEVGSLVRMIEGEHLDIRTTTMGISLRDCITDDLGRTCAKVYEKITRRAERLVATAAEVQATYGVPITNKRISVTPIALIAESSGAPSYVPLAETLDRAAATLGIDYIAGFSALIEKGITPGDAVLLDSIPEALSTTGRVCSSVQVATTRAGINMDAIAIMGRVIKATAERTADRGGIGCAKLVVFANMPEDNPFVAGANHGIGEGDCVINVGVSGPGVILEAIRRMKREGRRYDLGDVAETVKRMAFKVTRAGELIGREMVRRLGGDVRFGCVDLSLAPTPAIGDSVAEILEALGLERTGTHGTTAALALITDAVKKGGVMASSSVGGLSGAFIPVSEDHGMIEAVELGALSLDKLEAMTAVCSVGLDMVAVPGDTSAETLAAIIADEIAIGVVNNKTTAVRIIPVPGKGVGEKAVYGGLLGEAPVMPISKFSSAGFIRLGGRIPAPIISLRN